MTIMEANKGSVKDTQNNTNTTEKHEDKDINKQVNVFSDDNLPKNITMGASDIKDNIIELSSTSTNKPLVITSEDKVAFLDAVVANDRFTKAYSIFGGRISFTVRSLTSEEVQALAAWIIKAGSVDPAGQIAGRYRKYALAAQIAKYNDVTMPPLQAPLFPEMSTDGKTKKEPGWLDQSACWDNKPSGVLEAILSCLKDFNDIYATLCTKAEDANFWNPDTP